MEKTFEDNIQEIEKIIDSMEGGESTLDDMIKNYERGMKLINECSKRLLSAEKSLKVIEKDLNGALSEKPLDEHEKQDGSETIQGFKEKTQGKKKKEPEMKKPEETAPGTDEMELF